MRKFQKISSMSELDRSGSEDCCIISSGSRALRCLLFFFNVVFICTGFALGCSTVLILINHGGTVLTILMSQDRVPLYVGVVWLSLATTVLIFVNGVLVGTLAIKFDHRGIIAVYCFNLILISMAEVLIGMFSYVYYDQAENDLQGHMKFHILHSNNSLELHNVKTAIDEIQRDMNCCGARTYAEYAAQGETFSESDVATNFSVPDSCCKTESQGCGQTLHPSNIHYTGCAHPLALEIQYHLLIQGALGLSLCMIQMFGLFYSFLILCIKRRKPVDDEDLF